MNKSVMQATLAKQRKCAQDMGEALADEEDCPWYPLKDSEFWHTLDEIERIGNAADESGIAYLVDHTLIEDLEPMGRGMILSFAALVAVTQIPQAAQREILRRASSFRADDSRFRKIGWCLLMEAAGMTYPSVVSFSPQIDSLIEQMVGDSDPEVHMRAATIRSERRGEVTRTHDAWCFFCPKASE